MLPELLTDFVYNGDTAHCFLSTAHAIARSKDPDYIAMALPHFPEALKRASWATQNFGNLACSYLDMGGDPEGLIEPVQAIFDSQQDDAKDSFCRQDKELKLAKHLCSGGFISLLNHPRVKESRKLAHTLQPFAGEVIWDKESQSIFRTHIYILACVQGNRTGLAWAPSDEYARYTSVNNLSPLREEFLRRAEPEDIAEIAIRLFERMKSIPRREISTAAHQAVKKLKAGCSADISALAARREEWKIAELDKDFA